jgi:hypothetical protein
MQRLGRFTTSDPDHIGGNTFDPQSWNAYAYARNNPFRFVDPNGTDYEVALRNGTTLYLTNAQFDLLWENPGPGISFDGCGESGSLWIQQRYAEVRFVSVLLRFRGRDSAMPEIPRRRA